VLKVTWGLAADAVSGALEAAGWAASAVGDFIGDVFDTIDDISCSLDPWC
jgi:hypothetical protein